MTMWLVDFDNVIADLAGYYVESYNQTFRSSPRVEDITHCYWWAGNYISYGKYAWGSCFPDRDWALRIPPVPGSLRFLRWLVARGDEPIIVTERNAFMVEGLHAWFHRYNFHPAIVTACCSTKAAIAKELKIEHAVDDDPRSVVALAQALSPNVVYCFSRPWNRREVFAGNVIRVTSLSEIMMLEERQSQ